MRGKGNSKTLLPAWTRITPAYAGKRQPEKNPYPSEKDHPRLCGEKFSAPFTCPCFLGSPPPMRGKVYFVQVYKSVPRITPAYAGKSVIFIEFEEFRRDHPRLCGEKQNCTAFRSNNRGSPPPMRGKVYIMANDGFSAGITPAYAGKSLSWLWKRTKSKDHPRLCGEKGVSRCCSYASHRITPAYAGKSCTKVKNTTVP